MSKQDRYDKDKVAEVVLALMVLNLWEEGRGASAIYRAWKNLPWEALSRLHEQGYISNPRTQAKSVVLTEEGVRKAQEAFRRWFGTET